MTARVARLATTFWFVSALAWAQGGVRPPVRYTAVRIDNAATVRALQKAHGPEGFVTILHINRVDLPHVRQGATLVVPATPTVIGDASPFPLMLADSERVAPRLLIVSRRIQAFAAYEDGRLVRWGATSTGRRETPTPAGLFATNWRAKLRRSSDNANWLLPWYFNFVNASGVSFHQFELPGYPASHACVRLFEADAKWIYDWAESWVLAAGGRDVAVHGTPVLVFGDYEYGKPGPWTRLADNPAAADVSAAELTAALAPHLATIAERARVRALLPQMQIIEREVGQRSHANR